MPRAGALNRGRSFAALQLRGSLALLPPEDIPSVATESAPEPCAAAPLPELPAAPTLADILSKRLHVAKLDFPFAVLQHGVQSATKARSAGLDEETVLACLLHDIGQSLAAPDHGWWGAQLIEPYVTEKVSWAVRHHQALRFYPDPAVGYEYPELYHRLFGRDHKPPPYIEAAYHYARNHPWYMVARSVTIFDDYSFDPQGSASLGPFLDIIGRHFRQPAQGLGYDGSPVAHMWRTLINPARPL
jgi:hypothetical protein